MQESLPDLKDQFNVDPSWLTQEKTEAKKSTSQAQPPARDLTMTTPFTSQNLFTSKATIPKPPKNQAQSQVDQSHK